MILIILILISAIALQKSRRGNVPTVRRLPAVDALDEVVGVEQHPRLPVVHQPYVNVVDYLQHLFLLALYPEVHCVGNNHPRPLAHLGERVQLQLGHYVS